MIKTVILLITVVICSSVHAEYRVYQYIVKNLSPNLVDINKNHPIIRTSTLDPVTFVAYNGGKNSVHVDLLRTWKCNGNTSKKEYCASPYSVLTK
ncbi:MAG: hypothetical protein ACI9QD_000808 [Thermoproteota archaeon]|jgi:hypothetical protein